MGQIFCNPLKSYRDEALAAELIKRGYGVYCRGEDGWLHDLYLDELEEQLGCGCSYYEPTNGGQDDGK